MLYLRVNSWLFDAIGAIETAPVSSTGVMMSSPVQSNCR